MSLSVEILAAGGNDPVIYSSVLLLDGASARASSHGGNPVDELNKQSQAFVLNKYSTVSLY